MRIYSLVITALVTLFTGLNAQIVTYPYVEDFEAGAGGWTVAGTGTWALGAPANVIINGAASGANAWVTNLTGLYNNNESGSVVSPVFNFTTVPNPAIQFSVFWNAEFSWDGMALQSSIDGGLSWQNVGALGDPVNWYTDNSINGNPGGQQIGWSGRISSGNGSNGWLNASHDLTGLGGLASVTLRVAFGSDGSVQDEGVAFDNVNIFNVTCPQPLALTATSVLSNSANLGWTESGTATTWNIEYGPAGFVPTGVPTIAGTTNNPQNVTGLLANTSYEFYVQSDCGAGGTSVWTGPFSFLTLCDAVIAPWLDDVEAHTPTTNLATSQCWSTTSVSAYDWNIDGAGSTPSGGTGPLAANSGVNYFYIEASNGSAGDEAVLNSPLVDITALTSPALQYYYHMFGPVTGNLYVDIYDGLVWNTVDSIMGQQQTAQSDPWLLRQVSLLGYSGTIQVRFRAVSNGTFTGDISLDDIEVLNVTCPLPLNLTATNLTAYTADLGWTESGTATTWNIEYGLAGFVPTGVPTIAGTSNNPQNITGLTLTTSYDFYVQSDCGGGGLSIWAGPFTFTTTVSCPEPTALNVNAVTQNTADLGWTENGSAPSWQVEYGINGFVLGTGTSAVTGSNPYNVTGLTQNTAYGFYVRAICGPGDTSLWTGPFNFMTPCDVAIAPWLDDVETHTPTTNLVNSQCWSTSSVSAYDWNIDGLGSTPSTGTGPNAANSGVNYFYVEASSGSAGDEALLNSPQVDITALTSPGLQFNYHMFGSIMGDLYVDIYDGILWTTVDSIIGQQQTAQADPWLVKQVDLAAFSGIIQVRFRASSSGTFAGDISIDDIEILDLCFAASTLTASNITSTSADLGWTTVGTAPSWEVEYGTTGFVPGAGTSVISGTNPLSVTGLSPSTDYDFYVRSICGAGDSSIWMGPFTFTTLCATSPVTDTQQACGSYTWIDGMTYTANNTTATYMLTSSGGCDSLVMLDLTIINVVNGITQSGATLTATGLVAAYQWLDCDNNYSIIAGEVNQSYTATTTGNYAVEVNQNGCVDTSACVLIDVTGLDEMEIYGINVYPNPSLDGQFTVTSNDPIKNINILDLQGRKVTLPTNVSAGKVDGSILEKGKYIVQIITEKNIFTKEIVIMK